MVGYEANKAAIRARLRRIEGQVRGVERMVDDDAYCIEVLTQIAAATRALQGVALELLDGHLEHCVRGAIVAGDEAASEKIREATAAIRRLVRS